MAKCTEDNFEYFESNTNKGRNTHLLLLHYSVIILCRRERDSPSIYTQGHRGIATFGPFQPKKGTRIALNNPMDGWGKDRVPKKMQMQQWSCARLSQMMGRSHSGVLLLRNFLLMMLWCHLQSHWQDAVAIWNFLAFISLCFTRLQCWFTVDGTNNFDFSHL